MIQRGIGPNSRVISAGIAYSEGHEIKFVGQAGKVDSLRSHILYDNKVYDLDEACRLLLQRVLELVL